MRILVVTKSVPFPPQDGSAIRNAALLRELATQHEVALVTFVRNEREQGGLKEAERICDRVYPVFEARTFRRRVVDAAESLLTGRPFTICAHHSRTLRRALARAVEEWQPEIVQVQELYLLASIPPLQAPLVLDVHNIDHKILSGMARISSGLKRYLCRWQSRQMERFELAALARADAVCTLSRAELEWFAARHPRVVYLPNGVDSRNEPPARSPSSPPRILFVGSLGYPPNRDAIEFFLSSIWPSIASHPSRPNLRIVGAPASWCSRYKKFPRVHFAGRVESVEKELREATVSVVPLRAGAGTRLKILEAFSAGVPVVSTTLGAEGIEVEDGQEILLRDDPREFALAVRHVLHNPAYGERIAGNAFRWCQSSLRWDGLASSLSPLYLELTEERKAAQGHSRRRAAG